jgi:hypothetical protein
VEELESFRGEPTLDAAIERAAHARRPDGKRYDHQRRLTETALREAYLRLRQLDLSSCRSFDELHELVAASIGSIPGVGDLMVYDTALRIGAKLALSPSLVYLHCGTRDGARALGLNWRAQKLEMADIPEALQELEPREVEDCLCIFKKDLAVLGSRLTPWR